MSGRIDILGYHLWRLSLIHIYTYDGGLHLNVYGAEKLARHFGGYLKEHFNLKDRRQDKELKKQWGKKVDFYYSMKEEQVKELEEFGYLKSIFGDKQNN